MDEIQTQPTDQQPAWTPEVGFPNPAQEDEIVKSFQDAGVGGDMPLTSQKETIYTPEVEPEVPVQASDNVSSEVPEAPLETSAEEIPAVETSPETDPVEDVERIENDVFELVDQAGSKIEAAKKELDRRDAAVAEKQKLIAEEKKSIDKIRSSIAASEKKFEDFRNLRPKSWKEVN